MKQVKADTIARTICLALAIANQILAIMGKDMLPFGEDDVYQTCSLIATILTSLVAWWKNNSFTAAAIKGDEVMQKEKLIAKSIKG